MRSLQIRFLIFVMFVSCGFSLQGATRWGVTLKPVPPKLKAVLTLEAAAIEKIASALRGKIDVLQEENVAVKAAIEGLLSTGDFQDALKHVDTCGLHGQVHSELVARGVSEEKCHAFAHATRCVVCGSYDAVDLKRILLTILFSPYATDEVACDLSDELQPDGVTSIHDPGLDDDLGQLASLTLEDCDSVSVGYKLAMP